MLSRGETYLEEMLLELAQVVAAKGRRTGPGYWTLAQSRIHKTGRWGYLVHVRRPCLD